MVSLNSHFLVQCVFGTNRIFYRLLFYIQLIASVAQELLAYIQVFSLSFTNISQLVSAPLGGSASLSPTKIAIKKNIPILDLLLLSLCSASTDQAYV